MHRRSLLAGAAHAGISDPGVRVSTLHSAGWLSADLGLARQSPGYFERTIDRILGCHQDLICIATMARPAHSRGAPIGDARCYATFKWVIANWRFIALPA